MNLEKAKQNLQSQKQKLLTKIAALNKDIRHENKPMEKDFSEQATEAENDDVIHALFNDANIELRKINKALERLDQGEYNICAECGDEIALGRLEAIPFTDLCIRCAQEKE